MEGGGNWVLTHSNIKPCMMNGDREDRVEEWKEEFLGRSKSKEFRGLTARLNLMDLDCANL
eukprot:8908725-Karenia_brevis.AAC.1